MFLEKGFTSTFIKITSFLINHVQQMVVPPINLFFLFNAVIDSFDLREIDLTGRQFTWANSLSIPTYEKLDRVLMTTEWE